VPAGPVPTRVIVPLGGTLVRGTVSAHGRGVPSTVAATSALPSTLLAAIGADRIVVVTFSGTVTVPVAVGVTVSPYAILLGASVSATIV
jgi:hypothetical protein